jgi:hypothetical protein
MDEDPDDLTLEEDFYAFLNVARDVSQYFSADF